MSNAMRSSKSTLAGVAVGALTLGMLPLVAVAVAPAANAATVTGTVSPVRVTTVPAGTRETVPYAALAWTSSGALANTDTVVVSLTSGPAGSTLYASETSKIGTASPQSASSPTYVDIAPLGSGTVENDATVSAAGTAKVGIAASLPGTYSGTAVSYASGVAVDTVNWSFTTTGAAASITLTPASQTVNVGAAAPLTVTALGSNGLPTQIASTEQVALTTTTGTLGTATLSSANMALGTADTTLTQASSGTATVTATPQGTFPSSATAQTATVTASGAISSLLLSNIAVTAPATANDAGTQPNISADIPAGSATVTLAVTGNAGATAGQIVRLEGTASAGTPSAASPAYVNVTLDADKKGTATFTLTGDALLNNATFTALQVDATNATVTGPARVVLTQKTRVTSASDITVSPSGANVRKLGTETAVTVNVADQFGDGMSGYAVRSYRNATAGTNFLTLGTTDASGNATVTVSGASGITTGTTEQYSFRATSPAGTDTDKNAALSIEYTTTGDITGLSVGVSTAGATTPITNATTSIAVLPYALVPYDGTVDSAATGTYTVSSGAGAAAGEYVTFTPTATPSNSVTVTVPTGVKVATSLTNLIWSGGAQTATVATGAPVYVFATKTGEHDVTFTSGSITATTKIKVATAPAASYNMAVTPAAQTVRPGAFTTVSVEVTDVFGNPVPGATGTGTGGVTLTATGDILFAGLTNTTNTTTGADGKAVVAVVAGQVGKGMIAAAPQATTSTPAWVAGYPPPTGAPAPVTSAAAEVIVEAADTKSILIAGERTTVSGRSGIIVDGIVTGIEDGKTVVPYIRFPGQTTFTAGSARPEITDGEFVWQRKTGKRVTVYVTNDDGDIRSNRVTIQTS